MPTLCLAARQVQGHKDKQGLASVCLLSTEPMESVEPMTGKERTWSYLTWWLMPFRETLTWFLC